MPGIAGYPVTCSRVLQIAFILGIAGTTPSSAQEWTIDPKTSLAWWQINPHLGHLWATTCPEDESWQPGESRGSDARVNKATRKEVSIVNDDEPRIPVYPRDKVTPVCSEAVSGAIAIADSVRWTGVRGIISVRMSALYNGMEMRDEFARRAVYSTAEFPEVRFYMDSLVNVRRGDTLRADAVGKFEFRGVRTAVSVPLEAWHEGRGLRVQGRFSFPAKELISVYHVSPFTLGLGLATHIWKTIHMGFDVVLRSGGGGRQS